MIFIGQELADPKAHFVTNIVNSIGTGNDLVIDLQRVQDWSEIAKLIREHCTRVCEQFTLYNAYTDESFPLHFKRDFPNLTLITFFSDDEWRHENYDRYLALFSDVFTIAVRSNVVRYHAYGFENVYYMRWGCNPILFYPATGLEQVYDVTFVGAAYGQRVEYIRHLLRAGIKLTVFGPGWGRHSDVRDHWGGILSHRDMIQVISQSKINLNFLWTSRGNGATTIKGRTLELAACRAFQLSNHTDEFTNYGLIPSENIAVFEDKHDLLIRIRYYLTHPADRDKIANAAYRHVLDQLTWQAEFADLFERIRLGEFRQPVLPHFKVLVIVADGVRHSINVDDSRLDITLAADNRYHSDLNEYHGVIRLDRDSTINNDSLYMMGFGIHADRADCVMTNFYVGRSRYWIRFRDQTIRRKRKLITILPQACLMTTGSTWTQQQQILSDEESRIAFIEYPSFSIELPYFRARLLRLFFCDHGDMRKRIRLCVRTWRIDKMLSILIDRLWQKNFVCS